MENNLNKLLLRQIKRHFGSFDHIPGELKGFIQDINSTYENFEDDTQLIQNSMEISSQELRDAFQKHKNDAETQKETINKIKEAIYALNPTGHTNIGESESTPSDSSFLFESLIKLIEERKRAEEERVRQSGLITSMLDSIPDIIFFKDTEGVYLGCNPPFAEFVGKSKNEIIGRNDYDLFGKETADLFISYDNEMLRLKQSHHHEEWIIYPDGRKILIDTLKTPYWASDGSLIGILGISRDITKRKEAEEAVLQSLKKWEAIISASPDGIGMVSLDGKLQFMSDKLAIIHGYSIEQREEYLNKTIFDFIDPSNHELMMDNIHKLLRGEKDQKITEYLAVKKDNSRFYIDVNSTVLLDAKGDPESILFVERDITERMEAKELLLNERALFRTIIDLIPDAVYVKDLEGRKILANPKEVQFAGKNSEYEIIGKTDANLYPDADTKRAMAEDQFVLETGQSILEIEGTLIDGEGRHHWFLVSKVPLHDVHGKITGLIGVTHDISARKQTENELKQISTRLALAARAGGVGVWDLDLVNDYLLWDDQMFALYGVDKKNTHDAFKTRLEGVHPEDAVQVDAQIHMAIIGEKEFDTEFRVVWPDGSIHNIRALATVQRDNSGIPLNIIGTNWDITEQKKIEATLLIAKQEADTANKAKSEFLANMSHEIRTPLNGVIGFTDLLIRTPLDKIQQQYAKNANTSGHSLLGIINDILDFSKIEAGKMELDWIRTDIVELAELTSDIVKYHASQKGLELLLNIQHDIPRFAITDPTRLKQILVNLLGNAVKFTEFGEVELKVSFDKIDDSTGKFNFSVRDSGIGINEEQQKQLFKAFSQADTSTTRKFGGTGLGLTISNMLATKMGSKIEIRSEIGKGSNFFFSLIAAFEIGEKLDPGTLAGLNTVLVIDDNHNNRMILEHTLQDWGIEVFGIEDGRSAVRLIEKSKPFDVIIVDYHMPDINGLDTIKMIREQLNLTPEIQPIILLHSSSDDIEIYEECKKFGVIFNLTKPVKSQELLHFLKSIQNQNSAIMIDGENGAIRDTAERINDSSPVILVAEDVIINMMLVTTLIKQMVPNVTVYEAKNGKEAFEMTISKKPDLIIMDIQMPEMSGIEATLEIRNYEQGRGTRIPIVALTADAIKGEKEKCLDAGMDDFLTKPLNLKMLHQMLEKHLTFVHQHSDNYTFKRCETLTDLNFDQQMLKESIGHNQVILGEILEAVQIQFDKDLATLGNAISEKNLAEIKMAAHSIKGTSLNMRFNRMAELSRKIELFLDQDHFKELEKIFSEVILEWKQLRVLLKKMKF